MPYPFHGLYVHAALLLKPGLRGMYLICNYIPLLLSLSLHRYLGYSPETPLWVPITQ